MNLAGMKRPRRRTLLILAAASLLVPALLLSLLGLKLLRDFTEITRGFRSEYGDYMARIATSSVANIMACAPDLSLEKIWTSSMP